ncbi:MAG TPA: NAD(P)H-dependent glycerol-3-phosphate dehydrogenase [Polyangiaceae bacterium]|jgi:glycerol-3-phosphate dehydrogenase (NAD(P)+)|nr:NAD(P)H-dependent glycerol-3-phosphate dehydrogenase [Polyangiaceae bacterium]
MDRIAVLGAGAWGTALAQHLGSHGVPVALWARRAELADQLRRTRLNPLLPGVALAAAVQISDRMEEALVGAELVLLAAPSHTVRELLSQAAPHWPAAAVLVSAAKGIENDTLLTTAEVAGQVLGDRLRQRIVVLSGPSFAAEVAAGQPTSLVAAGDDIQIAERVQRELSLGRLRVYTSTDPMGVQVAGALKNVIAIAVGASDGLGFGQNARAALITRGLSEIARLGVAKGGRAETAAGLAGLGDLVLTCTGEMSRNRTVGFELGRGRPLAEVLAALGHVAEGVTTARSANDLAQRLGLELAICAQVYQVLYAGKLPQDAVEDLIRRPLVRE